ncbi:MAG TPA: DUF72 domain-containing protein [Bryobacteraceae bacterium]|nr:DUF72 domain-containing protein [Bryobacteraceae bacterium]
MTLPLFEEPSRFDRAGLAARLRNLAEQRIWIGTSSWKYEGWLDQIYHRERYAVHGKFSRKRFAAECLAEYAETFPIVCGDFSFYQFPPPQFWESLFHSMPASLRIALKAPEEVTCEKFPKHARYGPRAGETNPAYFDAGAMQAQFLEPLAPFAPRLGPVIFEFGSRSSEPMEFIDRLDSFLGALPQGFRYAVEIRNREYLAPRYFDALREHGVAHVLSSWSRMPPIGAQMTIANAFTADFMVARALLRPGRFYEDAVKMFTPYDRVQEEDPKTRAALRELIERMRAERRSAYVFVNNRLEGNAPETIRAITDGLAD